MKERFFQLIDSINKIKELYIDGNNNEIVVKEETNIPKEFFIHGRKNNIVLKTDSSNDQMRLPLEKEKLKENRTDSFVYDESFSGKTSFIKGDNNRVIIKGKQSVKRIAITGEGNNIRL